MDRVKPDQPMHKDLATSVKAAEIVCKQVCMYNILFLVFYSKQPVHL